MTKIELKRIKTALSIIKARFIEKIEDETIDSPSFSTIAEEELIVLVGFSKMHEMIANVRQEAILECKLKNKEKEFKFSKELEKEWDK